MDLMVDLIAHYTNFPYALQRAVELLPILMGRSHFNTKVVRGLQEQRRLGPDDRARLAAAYRSGQSVDLLTRLFRIHRTTVLGILEREGVPRRPHVRKLAAEHVALAGQLYGQGLSLAAVAAHLEVDAATIRKELARAGVPIRPRRGYSAL